MDVDALHHHALVQADRPEAGRLADHRGTAQRAAGGGQGARTAHRAFLVAGGEDQQRLAERPVEQRAYRLDDQREEALHVADAETIPAVVGLAQGQRVAPPQRSVEGHGVAVPGQHQAAGAAAVGRQQVGLAGSDVLDLAGEAEVAQPAGQALDQRTIGLVEARLGAAHRGQGDQLGELLLEAGKGHGGTPETVPCMIGRAGRGGNRRARTGRRGGRIRRRSPGGSRRTRWPGWRRPAG